MDQDLNNSTSVGEQQTTETAEVETFGWRFHKWPFLISLGLMIIFYLLVFMLANTSDGPLYR